MFRAKHQDYEIHECTQKFYKISRNGTWIIFEFKSISEAKEFIDKLKAEEENLPF